MPTQEVVGKRHFNKLVQIDKSTGLPTGVVVDNIEGQEGYIPDERDDSLCPSYFLVWIGEEATAECIQAEPEDIGAFSFVDNDVILSSSSIFSEGKFNIQLVLTEELDEDLIVNLSFSFTEGDEIRIISLSTIFPSHTTSFVAEYVYETSENIEIISTNIIEVSPNPNGIKVVIFN